MNNMHNDARHGRLAKVKARLEAGEKPDCPLSKWSNYRDVDGRQQQNEGTALHQSCAHGHPDVVEVLLEAGADPNAWQEGGYRPLHYAAYFEHERATKLLMMYGADPTLRDDLGQLPQAGRLNNNEKILEILAMQPSDFGLGELD